MVGAASESSNAGGRVFNAKRGRDVQYQMNNLRIFYYNNFWQSLMMKYKAAKLTSRKVR